MTRTCWVAALLVVVANTEDVRAQSANDLALSMTYSGFDGNTITGFVVPPPTSTGGSITQTRPQRMTIEARNLGPATAIDVVVTFVAGPAVSPFVTATAMGCSLDRIAPPLNGARWLLGTMPVGALQRCIVELRSIDAVPFSGAFGDSIVLRIAAASNVDPNPSNNNRVGALVSGSRIDYIRDMALSIASPTGILAPGSFRDVDFTFTNNGPGDEGDPNFRQLAYSDGYLVGPASTERFALADIGDPDCVLGAADIGGDTVTRYSDIRFGPLPPGTSRTCTLRVFILPGAVGTRVLGWYNWAEGSGIFDTNLANNRAQLVLQFPPAPVDAGSRWGWWVLAFLMLVVAAVRARQVAAPRRVP